MSDTRDPLSVIAEICALQPTDALEKIAQALGLAEPAAQQVRMLTDQELIEVRKQHRTTGVYRYADTIEFSRAIIARFAQENAGLTIPGSGKMEE